MDSQYIAQGIGNDCISALQIQNLYAESAVTNSNNVNTIANKNNHTHPSQYESLHVQQHEDDEELTEEENESEDNLDNPQDEDEDVTDASSACNSDSTEEEVPLSQLSEDIKELIQKMPGITDHYHILSKIGEGISPLLLWLTSQ